MKYKVQQNSLKNTIYSVDVDRKPNLKEKIALLHGPDSDVVKAAQELDRFVSAPESRQNCWYWNFYKRAKSSMWALYPHAADYVRTAMTRQFIDELFNGGYIRALRNLAAESGKKHVSFCREYADSYGVSIAAVLLFGPRGGAVMELLHFLAAERTHGQHRPGTSCNRRLSLTTQNMWYDANRACSWPQVSDNNGRYVPVDIPQQRGNLPDGVIPELRELWRTNPALYNYVGTNRLSGDIPYQIIEDAFDIIARREFSPDDRARYNRIIEQANREGIDPFYAVYDKLFADKETLRRYWDMARRFLYDYSISLWHAKNDIWLAKGKRQPAKGVVFRAKSTSAGKDTGKEAKVPGTIYLNNGGYYWVVAGKMKPRPLIDPESRPQLPGSFLCDNGRYYWYVPRWVKRKRLEPKGEKFSTKDKATAVKIAKKLWNDIKKNDPKLAANIIKHTRINGTATRDRAVAEEVRARMWQDIKKNRPELAAKILQDNRPKAKDKWYAQIVAQGRHRFIGSFDTKKEARAAYKKEFEKIWDCPAGYNVQCIPKIDKVWPAWSEQKQRLEKMDEGPRMPVIGSLNGTEPLDPMIRKMQKIDWLVENCMLVVDRNSPSACRGIAVQSRGENWYTEIKRQGKRAIICGSASIDKDTGRIRITVYEQGLAGSRVLCEEIFHIIFEIIRHTSPEVFASIEKWFSNRLKNGLDPTWQMHEAFAELMVREAQSAGSTDLPRRVVRYARNIFSSNKIVPARTMKKITAGV